MTYLSLRPPRRTRPQVVRAISWFAGLGLAFFCLVGPPEPGRLDATKSPPEGVLSFEEATPDSELSPPQPFPARQREKYLTQLGVSSWHQAGYRGQGLKIALLDTGFRGYRSHLGHALPAKVVARSFRSDGNLEARDSQHGILCGEIVHALAPDAELLVANWEPECAEHFVDAVRWARQQGARILTCSVIMPCYSDGEGGGPFHENLARIIGPGNHPDDMLCFASAGNTANRHWRGPFHDHGNGLHEWQTGQTDNTLTPWGKDQVSVELYWQPGAQYDLEVLNAVSGTVVGRSKWSPGSGQRSSAVVDFLPLDGCPYSVRVRLAEGKGGSFHLVALGGNLALATATGSIACPADGPEIVAVGAATDKGQRAPYSSCGPNSSRPKPDFVALVPFPSLWRSRPFSGTSAAAPQAAALAALWWCRHPNWTADQVRAALQASARDLGPPGHDWETGYGLLRLPEEKGNLAEQAFHTSLRP